jgi:hypothetical protein
LHEFLEEQHNAVSVLQSLHKPGSETASPSILTQLPLTTVSVRGPVTSVRQPLPSFAAGFLTTTPIASSGPQTVIGGQLINAPRPMTSSQAVIRQLLQRGNAVVIGSTPPVCRPIFTLSNAAGLAGHRIQLVIGPSIPKPQPLVKHEMNNVVIPSASLDGETQYEVAAAEADMYTIEGEGDQDSVLPEEGQV